MKKHNDCDGLSTYHQISRNCLRGLLILSFLLFQSFQLSAVGHAQNARLNLNLRNVSIADVFQAIKQQTKLSVVYNLNDVNPNHKVTVSATNEEVASVLNKVLKGTNLSYTIENNHIVLSTAKVENQKVTQSKPQGKAKSIKGVVTDSKGEPLIGVSVQIKGTNKGVMTDLDGKFVVSASKGDVLKLTYVGFKPKTAVAGDSDLSIMLEESSEVLEEVVVTALGIKREQKALTYNVQELKAADIIGVKDASFINGMAGKIAGVQINSSASGIGGSTRVVMRGTKSLFGNNNALYVVDGVPLPNLQSKQPNQFNESPDGGDSDGISNINPEDIESMSVLTGSAAAALYGSQGANGVVLITTKKGDIGKLNVTYSNSSQFMSPFVMPKFQNTYGSDAGSYYSWGKKLETPSSYDPKDFFQTGYNETNSVSLSSGTEKNQTYFSAAVVNARGIIPHNEFNRYNFSIRNTSQLIDNKLNLDLNASYISQNDQNMMTQGQYHNPILPIYLFPRGDDMSKYKVFERYNSERNFKTQFWPYGNQGLAMENPYWITNRENFNNVKHRYMLSAALRYEIVKGLNLTGRVKVDNTENVFTRKISASSDKLFASDAGNYLNHKSADNQIYADAILNYDKRFTNWGVVANLGASIMDQKNDMTGYEGHLLSVPNLFTFSNIDRNNAEAIALQDGFHDQTQAAFATAQLNYKSLVFLDISGRNDWCSMLANTESKSFFYPSVGLSGVVSDMLNLKSIGFSFLKVRSSYSEVGNAPQRFITMLTYPIIGGTPSTSSYNPATGLRPERTKSFEIGINARMLNNSVNLDLTYYNSNTYNQLFTFEAPPSTGYTKYFINAGKVNNWGIEAALGYKKKIAGIDWNSNLTFTLNRNEIKELVPEGTVDPTTGQTFSRDELIASEAGTYRMTLKKGGSMGDIYVSGLRTDHQGNIKVDPQTGSISTDPNTWMKAGNAAPKYNIGWRNSFSYKNIDLSFLLDARVGGVGVSATQALMDRFGVSEASAIARDNGGALLMVEELVQINIIQLLLVVVLVYCQSMFIALQMYV